MIAKLRRGAKRPIHFHLFIIKTTNGMKSILCQDRRYTSFLVILFVFPLLITGCKKMADVTADTRNNAGTNSEALLSSDGFQAIFLTANNDSYGALHVEPRLLNAWGLSAGPSGIIWLSAADGGLSFVYDNMGGEVIPPVAIPSHRDGKPGNPTGNIYNPTTDFIIPGTGLPSKFIFASEDGTVSAWNGGGTAIVVVDQHSHASYKGLAIASDRGQNYLYVTNFETGRVDVFDKDFNKVHNRPFEDQDIPEGYVPFNIRNVDSNLYVTYALKTADGEEDSTGVGLGFVDVYRPNGQLKKRFATQGTLNAPWGITTAPKGSGQGTWVLVANFGDGKINAFDPDGTYRGQLQDQGKDLVIEGLWAIETQIAGISPKQMYFTAGPRGEEDGLFGYITLR